MKEVCPGCGVRLKEGNMHPPCKWRPNGGKPFKPVECSPKAKDCLCDTVLHAYHSVKGLLKRKVPAHHANVCPLGVGFGKVAHLAMWVRAHGEEASHGEGTSAGPSPAPATPLCRVVKEGGGMKEENQYSDY